MSRRREAEVDATMPLRLQRWKAAEWPLEPGDQEGEADYTPEQAVWWRRVHAFRRYQTKRREWLLARGRPWCRAHGINLVGEFKNFPPGDGPTHQAWNQ